MGHIKDSDLKADQGKLRYDLIPINALAGIAGVFTYGSKKYDEFNWYRSLQPTRYYAAAMRHIMACQAGQKVDPESGLNHIDHAIVSLIMYRELTEKLIGTDMPTTYTDYINNIIED